MRQIPPHSLWLGHAGDGRDFRAILEAGLPAVVQLAVEEEAARVAARVDLLPLSACRRAGNEEKLLYLAVTTGREFARAQIPTLVCCGGG